MAITLFENIAHNLIWVDVTAPTSNELSELSKTYDLNHFALSACLQPDHLPKHEDIEGTPNDLTYLIMMLWCMQNGTIGFENQEDGKCEIVFKAEIKS